MARPIDTDSGSKGRRRLSTMFLMLFVLALSACAPPSEWRELKVDDAGFSVLMRGQPYYGRQQLDTPAGKMFVYLYSSDRPESFFAVGYADYPLVRVVGAPPEQIFAGIRDSWTRRIEGRLVARDNSIKLASKYPGTEFVVEGKLKDAGAFVHGRLYLVDQRLYQVIAMGRKGEVPQAVVNRFLNSFRLIQQTDVGTIQVEPAGK